jgi:hypothetical protein
MSVTGPVAELALGLADLFEPLLDRLATREDVEYLCSRYGWRVELDETAFAALSEGLTAREAIDGFVTIAGPLRQRLAAEGASALGADDVAAIAGALDAAIQAIDGFRAAALGGLPPPLDDEGFWSDVAEHLFDDLLEEYVRIHHPGLYVVLLASGVVRYEPTFPDGPHRRPYRRIVVDWSQIGRLAEDPSGTLRQRYRWGDGVEALDHALLVEVVERALRATRVATERTIPAVDVAPLPATSPYRIEPSADGLRSTFVNAVFADDGAIFELGLQLLIAARAGEERATGVILSPLVRGRGDGAVRLGGAELRWKAALSAGELLGVAVFPDGVELAGGDLALDASVELTDASAAPRYLFGSERTARIELNRPSLRLSIEGLASDPEARLHLRAGGDATAPGARLVVPLDDADGFVAESVPANALDLGFSPELIWSSRTGLTFNGQPTLDVDLPLSTSLGGVRIHDLHLALLRRGGSDERQAVELEASTGLDVRLGPVLATIDRIGMRLAFDFGASGGNLGFADLAFGFKPPSGIGIAVEAPAVSGGGYLFFDPAQGQYGGVVRLTVQGGLTLTAIGMISTRLHDGSRGFSFLVMITAEGFQPIQLGLGFTLTGIGGLLAVNRTCDDEFLRGGLKTKALDDVLFPADPIANAARLLSTFDRAFPARPGSYLFGPALQICWGTPPLVTMNLAVVLELGNRSRLIVLGRLAAVMPSEEHDLLRLHMSAIGVLDLDQGSLSLDAVLYDSRLAGKFPVTGSMAMRVGWGRQRELAISIGGFHPAFKPPPSLPALERLSITFSNSSDFRLRAEKYLAITANTLQFGAKVELYASAGGFAIAGMVGYDVLIQFDPFEFIAGFEASVQLKYHSRTLFKVAVSGELAGPRPLHVRGKATFEIFWCDYSVRFDRTLISGERPPALPAVNVTEQLVGALADPRNWGGELSDTHRGLVTIRATNTGDAIVVHPLGRVAVKQTVVPLELDIAKFGNAAPADAHRFDITAVTVDARPAPFARIDDFFAPAQFLELDDDEKLSAPSFESMVAGVDIGGQGPRFPGSDDDVLEDDALRYETIVIDGDGPPGAEAEPVPVDDDFVARYIALGAAAASGLRRTASARYRGGPARNSVEGERWSLAAREDGTAEQGPGDQGGNAGTFAATHQTLAEVRRIDASRARSLMLVRTAAGS